MREHHSIFVALITVAMAALVAALLIVAAFVEWLAEWFGSVVAPGLIVGGFFALLAFVVYRLTLRSALREFDDHFSIIYEMMKLLHSGVDWLKATLHKES